MSSVLSVVERSNQRGGRMLSVIDLLRAGTLSLAQACFLLVRIEQGASWLVGACPGGAGKTTIMSALLAMLREDEPVVLASGTGWSMPPQGACLVAYEIGQGDYEAYLWGQDLIRFCALGARGHRIVTNLHADTVQQAREQIVAANGVPEVHFRAFDVFIPIVMGGPRYTPIRRVQELYVADCGGWRLWEPGQMSARESAIGQFLQQAERDGLSTVAEVRHAWLAWRTT